MTVGRALQAGRRAAEHLMVDRCTIRRPGEPVTDPQTGQVTRNPTVVYQGRCKLQKSSTAGEQRREVGEASLVLVALELHLPVVGSEGILEGDEATIDTAQMDADLVGKVFRVVAPARGSLKTARRLPVVEVTS